MADDDDTADVTQAGLMGELRASAVYQKALEAVDDATRAAVERRVASFFAQFSRDLLVPLKAQAGSAEFKSALIDHLRKKVPVAPKKDD